MLRGMRLHKNIGLFLLISVVLGLIVFGMYKNQNVEQWEGMLDREEYVWEEQSDGSYRMECFSEKVDKGNYSLQVVYDSKEELQYKVVDMEQNNGKNELGKEILSGVFKDGGTETVEKFNLKKQTRKLTLYVTTKDPTIKMGYWIMNSQNYHLQDYILILISLIVIVYLMCNVFPISVRRTEWSILLVCSLFVSIPCLSTFLNTGHDLWFHLERIIGMKGAIQSGQFPVRLSTAFLTGYGFSVDMMYPELFLYIPALLYTLGVSLVSSYKFLLIIINIATAFIGYISFRNLLKSERMGIYCALLYLFNPYRLVNMYCRAAIGEVLAQIFLPLLVWGMYELILGEWEKWWIIVWGTTGIIQSHIISVEISLGFVILIVMIAILYRLWKKGETTFVLVKRFKSTLKSAILIIALNAWYLIPFLTQLSDNYSIKNQDMDMQIWALEIGDIFRLFVDFDGYSATATTARQLYLSISPVVLLGVFIYSYYAFYKKNIEKNVQKIGNACLALGGLSCYISSKLFPWNWIKNFQIIYRGLRMIQYPWRFLTYAAVFLTIVTAIAMNELFENKQQAIIGVLLGVMFIGTMNCIDEYMGGKILIERKSDVTEYVESTSSMDYYQEGTSIKEFMEQGDTVKSDKPLDIINYKRNGMNLSFDIENVMENTVLQLPIYDYNMHKVYLDGTELKTTKCVSNQLQVTIPKEKKAGHVEVKMVEWKIFKIGNVVSVLTILGWIVVKIGTRGGKNGKRKNIISCAVL